MSQVHKRVPFNKYIAGDAVKFNRYKEKQHFYSQAVLSSGLASTQMKEPEFVGGIPGTKVIAGKDAILRCVVENLGDYKVC
ncbi:ig-like domain-containing protein [Trichonephila inaurata madagascariensis]|uniref:Ig-like domain-containing protein n=1 Tax=Trichonephila inaurata madagascariensis TaxID=2747483 RepID=A0A8X6X5S4_9ARAC|nr:ig-like domain-containing protein [Trichonephila inaurata madagascariensis]